MHSSQDTKSNEIVWNWWQGAVSDHGQTSSTSQLSISRGLQGLWSVQAWWWIISRDQSQTEHESWGKVGECIKQHSQIHKCKKPEGSQGSTRLLLRDPGNANEKSYRVNHVRGLQGLDEHCVRDMKTLSVEREWHQASRTPVNLSARVESCSTYYYDASFGETVVNNTSSRTQWDGSAWREKAKISWALISAPSKWYVIENPSSSGSPTIP